MPLHDLEYLVVELGKATAGADEIALTETLNAYAEEGRRLASTTSAPGAVYAYFERPIIR